MVHDFSRRYSSVMAGRQQVVSRRSQAVATPFLLSKVLGSLVLLVVVAGIAMSVLLKMRIDADLSELARRIDQQNSLQNEGSALADRQKDLYALESVTGRAVALGLALPTEDQIRRP